jgi:hypothetical protein
MNRRIDPGTRRRRRKPGNLAGRDLARVRTAPGSRRRFLAILLAGGLLAGFSLVALRVDNLRLRYALAEALAQQQRLLEEHRVATARLEALRDPARLAALADERGLVRPQRVIELAPTQLAARSEP